MKLFLTSIVFLTRWHCMSLLWLLWGHLLCHMCSWYQGLLSCGSSRSWKIWSQVPSRTDCAWLWNQAKELFRTREVEGSDCSGFWNMCLSWFLWSCVLCNLWTTLEIKHFFNFSTCLQLHVNKTLNHFQFLNKREATLKMCFNTDLEI